MTVARVALPVGIDQAFDYWAPAGLALDRGSVVHVRLGARRLHGVVVGLDPRTDVAPERMRAIDSIADIAALPDAVLGLCRFVAAYSQAPLGQVPALALPPLARGATRRRPPAHETAAAERAQTARNDAQRAAVEAIQATHGSFAPFLLQGVTGSGKTEVYLDAAARAIEAGGQALMLVPAINLTPHLTARVRAALPG